MAIIIEKNPNGDTRTAPNEITFEQFQKANDMHREDVRKVMSFIAYRINRTGMKHDYTKKSDEELFYNDFLSTMNSGADFTKCEWYQMHINSERHHLSSRCPDDVNLIDVIEMIADCVCAGMARSGYVRDLEISSDILERAVKNTMELIVKEINLVN